MKENKYTNPCEGCIYDLSDTPGSEWCNAGNGDYCQARGRVLDDDDA